MRIALVLQPFSDENLRLAAQLGVEDIVTGIPAGDFTELAMLKSRIEDFGLRLSVIEGGARIDEVVAGGPGRDAQIEKAVEVLKDELRKNPPRQVAGQ